MVRIVETRRARKNLRHLVEIHKIQHSISFIEWVIEIIKRNEIDDVYILISTEIILSSSFLPLWQASFPFFALLTRIHHSRVNRTPNLHTVRKFRFMTSKGV